MRMSSGLAVAGKMLLAVAPLLAGCSSDTATPGVTTPQTVSNSYVGPNMNGGGNPVLGTYLIDRSTKTFVQETYDPSNGNQSYVKNSGNFTVLPQGVLAIGLTYSCAGTSVCVPAGVTYSPPQTGSWAVELPGQAALVQVLASPFVPLAPNTTCPNPAKAQTYQFVTIPSPLASKAAARAFSPTTDTAFGTFSLSASAGAITFGNVSQFTLPVAGGAPGAPANPSPASVTGLCAPTFYGQTISVPTFQTVTNPGNGQTTLPTATVAVGPAGFLVEDNGAFSTRGGTTAANPYQNLLGSGLGAVGLAQPSAPLTASSIVGAQYLGFLYGSGSTTGSASTSRIASFGLIGQQSACATLPAQTGTLIYGGEFTNNDPSANASGNCDFAIDLGAQDAKNNGLFASAKVYVSGAFVGNNGGKGTTYSFPAVAISGQLSGKNAIFLVGVDSIGTPNQAWGLYLLQSN